jgi:protocatechuate 3,4-dioxygenase beta subunit
MTTTKARPTTVDDITNETLRRFEGTPDPRLREIMVSLTKHLHAFVKDVKLTEAEWFEAIKFLTATGHKCDDIRQEFILLSDTMGVSMVVDLISNPKPPGATESTVFGPFHRDGAAEMPMGSNIAPKDTKGQPATISGRVLDTAGNPIAGAVLDVWQANSEGFYDAQLPNHDELHMRGIFKTGADGRYELKTTRPVHYPIPTDGPVGTMLNATNRHPHRPAHTHFRISAPGFAPVTTHLFDRIDPYLESDAVLGVKESLIVDFKDDGKGGVAASYDFVLAPSK